MDTRGRTGRSLLEDRGAARQDDGGDVGWPGKATPLSQLSVDGGQPLPAEVRGDLESGLGADLGGVRVHVGADAQAAAQSLHARAFTVGQAVYFGAGQYDPGSASGKQLLAHEVAHTVQQQGASGSPQLASLEVSSPGDTHEREAEAFAESFLARGPGAKASLTPVSRGVVARAVIQRDMLPGGVPDAASVNPQVQPIPTDAPASSELAEAVAKAIRDARTKGGSAAAIAEARQMYANAGSSGASVKQGVEGELTDEEKKQLAGNAAAAGAGPGAAPANPNANANNANANNANANNANAAGNNNAANANAAGNNNAANANAGGNNANAANANAGGNNANAGGEAAAKDGGAPEAKGGGAAPAAAPGNANANAGGKGAGVDAKGAAVAPAGGAPQVQAPANNAGPEAEPAPQATPAQERSLIEAELAFHENWQALSGGAGGRALQLLKGSGGDLLGGLKGAAYQSGGGALVKALTTKTALAKVPGAGAMIGGAMAAYSLFSDGGKGFNDKFGEATSGIGAAFSASAWKESPWQTAADLVGGIVAALSLIGSLCSILSGLAYAFAAIAALGGLLSWLFPPLAFLVPYIPAAIQFGRFVGGISTVCAAVSNALSPIPPVLRAIHIIFSDNDPIKLVAQEEKYHGEMQSAIANYASTAFDRGMDKSKTGINPLAAYKEGAKQGFGEMKGNSGFVKTGWNATKEDMPDTGTAGAMGKGYFDTDARAKMTPDQLKEDKETARKAQKSADYFEKRGDQAFDKFEQGKMSWDDMNVAAGKADAATIKAEGLHQNVAVGQQHLAIGHQEEFDGDSGNQFGNAAGVVEKNIVGDGGKDAATAAFQAHRGDGPGPVAQKNAKGHVVLPDPPSSLEAIDALDTAIADLRSKVPEQRQVTKMAKGLQQEAQGVGKSIGAAKTEVDTKSKAEQARGDAAQTKITAQSADIKSRGDQAGQSADGQTQKAAGPLVSILDTGRTVHGLLLRVPSNRFFDVAPAQANVGKFVSGIESITGAGAGNAEVKQQQGAAVEQRKADTQKAAGLSNQARNASGQIIGKLTNDQQQALGLSQDAAEAAATSVQEEKTLEQQLAEKKAERDRQWGELMGWAVNHRALRFQVDPPKD